MVESPLLYPWTNILVLAVWLVVCMILTIRFFRYK